MKKVLITFGDSWPQGGELDNGRRYGEILQDQMQFDKFYNYGSGGASNEDMLYQFQQHLSESHCATSSTTAIFFLTNPARTAHFPRFFSWQDTPQNFKELYLHFHKTEHQTLRNSATVSALQMWCSTFGIQDYYFSGWVRYPEWLPGVDVSRIWAQGNETVADWFGASDHNGEHLINVENNPYIRPNFAHPNQLGHQLIADRLQRWIESTP
jgi:hypothetical protein